MEDSTAAVGRIRAVLGSLVASERRVADVVLADPAAVVRMTASQLGARADTSATTVVRFARSAGFSGYQELAISLAMGERTERPTPIELTPASSAADILACVSATASRAVAACATTVRPEELQTAIDALAGARQVLCLGAGLGLPVAADLAMRLNHLGITAEAPADRQLQRMRAMRLEPGEVCVAVLQGGTYVPIVTAARDAQRAGAHVIAVTPFRGTPLTEVATTALVTGADAVRTMVDAWPLRMQFVMVVDALIVGVMHADPERSARALQELSDAIERDDL